MEVPLALLFGEKELDRSLTNPNRHDIVESPDVRHPEERPNSARIRGLGGKTVMFGFVVRNEGEQESHQRRRDAGDP